MSSKKAKKIRRVAVGLAHAHYLTLVEESEQHLVTRELAWENTPDCSYLSVETNGVDEYSREHDLNYVVPRIRMASQYTKRWFFKQAKKVAKDYV